MFAKKDDDKEIPLRYTLKEWLNLKDLTGRRATPIHYASYHGCKQMILYLLQMGADLNICALNRLNALHFAAQGNKPELMHFLVSKMNMDINSANQSGLTSLHWAVCY